MFLAIDIGNTQTVIGLYGSDALMHTWRVATVHSDTADEIVVRLGALLSLEGFALGDVDDVAIASVVPSLTEQWAAVGLRLAGRDPLVVTSATVNSMLAIDYSLPAEIGADRIADAVAAVDLYGAPVVVVDFGTATNIEVIDKNGAFIGGIIAPGLVTSAEALFGAAARIQKFDIEVPPHVIGRSTREAVQAGLTYGEIDRIDGLITRIFAELGYSTPVVATGGLSERVTSLSRTITHVNPNLTLEGLRLIHGFNR
jgi:type III pantothenate kinase